MANARFDIFGYTLRITADLLRVVFQPRALALQNYDTAFRYLEESVRQRDPMLICIPTFDWWGPIRSDAIFVRICEQMGLTDYPSRIK